MWHEFAIGVDFADPRATIDLLIAADQITRSPDCDRATAALLLAKAAVAGFHRGDCPAGFDETAARAFAVRLTDALVTGVYETARLALPPLALRMVRAELGPARAAAPAALGLWQPPASGALRIRGLAPVSTASSRARAA